MKPETPQFSERCSGPSCHTNKNSLEKLKIMHIAIFFNLVTNPPNFTVENSKKERKNLCKQAEPPITKTEILKSQFKLLQIGPSVFCFLFFWQVTTIKE